MTDRYLTQRERVSIAAAYTKGSSSEALARRFHCTANAVLYTLRHAGIPRRSLADAQRRYPLEETAFDTLTPESAYWVGFLMADGCVSDKANGAPAISLQLTASDVGHVRAFARFAGSGHPLVWIHETTLKQVMDGDER